MRRTRTPVRCALSRIVLCSTLLLALLPLALLSAASSHAEEDPAGVGGAGSDTYILRVPLQHRTRALNILKNEGFEARDPGTQRPVTVQPMSGLAPQPDNAVLAFAVAAILAQRMDSLIEDVGGDQEGWFYVKLTPPANSGAAGEQALVEAHTWIQENIEKLATSEAVHLYSIDRVRPADERWPRPAVYLKWKVPFPFKLNERAKANLHVDLQRLQQSFDVRARMSSPPKTRTHKAKGVRTHVKTLDLTGDDLSPERMLEIIASLMNDDGVRVTKFAYKRNSEEQGPPTVRIELSGNDPWFTSVQLRNQMAGAPAPEGGEYAVFDVELPVARQLEFARLLVAGGTKLLHAKTGKELVPTSPDSWALRPRAFRVLEPFLSLFQKAQLEPRGYGVRSDRHFAVLRLADPEEGPTLRVQVHDRLTANWAVIDASATLQEWVGRCRVLRPNEMRWRHDLSPGDEARDALFESNIRASEGATYESMQLRALAAPPSADAILVELRKRGWTVRPIEIYTRGRHEVGASDGRGHEDLVREGVRLHSLDLSCRHEAASLADVLALRALFATSPWRIHLLDFEPVEEGEQAFPQPVRLTMKLHYACKLFP